MTCACRPNAPWPCSKKGWAAAPRTISDHDAVGADDDARTGTWQDESMNPTAAQRSARGVGIVTLLIGIALVAVPSRAGRLLRTGDHPTALRIIGASDLALVPGLLVSRRPWRWMAARAGLNVVIAAYCLWLARREGTVGAKIGAAAMVAATVADSRTIAALRRLP